ncbi:acid protease [Lentinus tigrinus ALCF2SS1-7]|uniref:Acid protease n=1 Tax=Lentinus tigrinus ALCF2SS1-6 TaxID=1328759 RepID=A0A5C2SBG7_9APHY|nr:acid protease [Lentinus tigrinus ALCF2SS1-6]RPD75736.1 acid protease [Lentinus tigrinus ALCF2SS1-7]
MLITHALASALLLTSSAFSRASAATLDRRAPASNYPVSVSRGADSTGFGFTNVQDNLYSATITVNGVAFQVQLDTGSADTWIDPLSVGGAVPPNLIYTNYNATTTYLDGSSGAGPIVLADVTFGSYTIKNQAITLGYGNGESDTMNGLLGLGGSSRSQIYATLMNTSYADNAKAMLYNLFAHEPDRPDYVTWLMSRTELGDGSGGVLTVSEVLANMTDILDAPQLNSLMSGEWVYWLDGIYINGRFFGGHSNVTQQYKSAGISVPSENSTVAVFDSGTSLILAPEYYAHLIYQDVPGASAVYADGDLVYVVPCDTKLNISWSVEGNIYPMHPIDVVTINETPQGVICSGTIRGSDNSALLIDWILGDAFLRNVYHLYGYGNSSAIRADPYIKLLSVVDQAQAWAEADAMIQARVQAHEYNLTASHTSTPATVRPSYTGQVPSVSLTYVPESSTASAAGNTHLAAAGALAESDSNSGQGGKPVDLSGLERNSYIIMGLLSGVIVLLLAVVGMSVKAARANRRYEPLVPPVGVKGFEMDRPYDR